MILHVKLGVLECCGPQFGKCYHKLSETMTFKSTLQHSAQNMPLSVLLILELDSGPAMFGRPAPRACGECCGKVGTIRVFQRRNRNPAASHHSGRLGSQQAKPQDSGCLILACMGVFCNFGPFTHQVRPACSLEGLNPVI